MNKSQVQFQIMPLLKKHEITAASKAADGQFDVNQAAAKSKSYLHQDIKMVPNKHNGDK